MKQARQELLSGPQRISRIIDALIEKTQAGELYWRPKGDTFRTKVSGVEVFVTPDGEFNIVHPEFDVVCEAKSGEPYLHAVARRSALSADAVIEALIEDVNQMVTT